MLKSMTAYGRAKVSSSLGTLAIEIQSVNRKHLEIQTNLPREFIPFDSDIKKWISETVSRGQVNVRLIASFDKDGMQKLQLNRPLAKQLQYAVENLREEVSSQQEIGLDFFLNYPGMILVDEAAIDPELCRKVLKEVLDLALKNLSQMKEVEGAILQKEMAGRLKTLQEAIGEIEQRSSQATEKYRVKLKEKLEEILPGSVENEERLLREICVYADKIDIVEEIVRFRSHLNQAEQLIHSHHDRVGKNLEFTLQELNREINTIGSKTGDVQVSHLVVNCKTELERIREQLQNVE